MKIALALSAIVLAGAGTAAAAQDKDPATRKIGESSTRTSSFGTLVDVTVRKDDDLGVDATFEDGGKFATKEIVARDRFEGLWTTTSGDKECATAQQGTKHWGKLWFKMSEMGRVFTGKWGYCDAEPDEEFKAEWKKP